MKVYNPVSSGKASGRALGGVFSFNRGMATFKKYVKPRQPNTDEQQAVKTRFATLTKYWKNNLTYAQIVLWNDWDLPWLDIYGATVLLTGINKFVICNEILLKAGKSITEIPPTSTPSEITLTPTTDLRYTNLSIEGVSNAEVTAQEPFYEIQTPGIPETIETVTRQIGLYWDGMPRSRIPLEKNWKTILFHDCVAGYEGVEELKLLMQTITSEIGLQPMRIQRFNKFGYWSGKVTYINQISVNTLVNNGNFLVDEHWSETGGNIWIYHYLTWTTNGTWYQNVEGIEGHTYRFNIDITFVDASTGTFKTYYQGIEIHSTTVDGQFQFDHILTSAQSREFKFDVVVSGYIRIYSCSITDITP